MPAQAAAAGSAPPAAPRRALQAEHVDARAQLSSSPVPPLAHRTIAMTMTTSSAPVIRTRFEERSVVQGVLYTATDVQTQEGEASHPADASRSQRYGHELHQESCPDGRHTRRVRALARCHHCHPSGPGQEVGFARVSGHQAVRSLTHGSRSARPCEELSLVGLSATRAERSVTGKLRRSTDCVFEGSMTFPEDGRW